MTFKRFDIHLVKRWSLSIFLGMIAFALTVSAAFFAWVITGPRSIDSVTPYIESALSLDARYKVKIESSAIKWEGINNPLAVSVKNVEVIDDKGNILSYFPEIVVKIYLYKVLIGTFDIKSLEFLYPSIMLTQERDGKVGIGGTQDAENGSGSGVFAAVLEIVTAKNGHGTLDHLKYLAFRHATFSLKDKISGAVLLQSSDAMLEISRKHGNAYVTGDLRLPLLFDNHVSQLSSTFSLDKRNGIISARLEGTSFPVSALHGLFPLQPWFQDINVTFSGNLQLVADWQGNVKNADFMAQSEAGSIKYPELFPEPLSFQHISLAGKILDNLSVIKVNEGKISLVNSNAKASDLLFSGTLSKSGGDYALDAHAQTANVPIGDVRRYWPLTLSPHSRAWVTQHISGGTIEKADVDLHFKPGDMPLKDTPEEDVQSDIAVNNVTIQYMPKHPAVTDINGTIHFTGRSMDARVTSAKYMGGTQIMSASIKMPDMYPDDVRMLIDMNFNAPAADVATFLALPEIDRAKRVGIASDAAGSMVGNAKLNFIAFSEHEDEKNHDSGDISYSLDATLNGFTQKAFLGNLDVEKADMLLAVNNKGVKAAGKATLNSVPMEIDLASAFNKEHTTDYTVKCDMPVAALHRFGLPPLDSASGTIGVKASFSESDNYDTSEEELELTNATIAFPEHGFLKKTGEKAVLEMKTERLPSGNTAIPSFHLQGSAMEMSGNAEFEKATGNVLVASFNKLVYANNAINSLHYTRNQGGFELSAKGKIIDASPYLNARDTKNEAYKLDISADTLLLGEGRELYQANIKADCGITCRYASATAKLKDKGSFDYNIKDGKLVSSTDNAGELLRVLGVYNGMEGGKMVLTGEYSDKRIDGIMTIQDYTVKQAPLLTKMLTIASLTGFLDTLTGNGIAFTKLYMPYSYQAGIIVLKEAKTHGPALGLTADGTIDMNKSALDLKGVLVPSYTVNSLIGNVPIIGDLLVGGKGKGIIGMNYSVKGATADPSITVNPFSVLTPGFLRGIFNIFDRPAPDLDKIIAEHEKEERKRDNTLPPMELLKGQ